MKKIGAVLILIGFMIVNTATLSGCKNKRPIISFKDNDVLINIVGYAKPAPFSSDPNFYCFLKIDKDFSVSKQIDYAIFFRDVNVGLCIIYQDSDGEKFLIPGLKAEKRIRIDKADEVLSLDFNVQRLNNFKFTVLEHDFSLNNINCVLFSWHNGGVAFFSFKDFYEGISSSFKYKIKGKFDLAQSGKIAFTDYSRDNEGWPEIKNIQFPLQEY